MASRRPYIHQRTPIYLACEGSSEYGYVRWLNRLARTSGALVAIKAERLQGGDPLELVESAISKLRHWDRPGARFDLRGLLLDAALRADNPRRSNRPAGRIFIKGLLFTSPVRVAANMDMFVG